MPIRRRRRHSMCRSRGDSVKGFAAASAHVCATCALKSPLPDVVRLRRPCEVSRLPVCPPSRTRCFMARILFWDRGVRKRRARRRSLRLVVDGGDLGVGSAAAGAAAASGTPAGATVKEVGTTAAPAATAAVAAVLDHVRRRRHSSTRPSPTITRARPTTQAGTQADGGSKRRRHIQRSARLLSGSSLDLGDSADRRATTQGTIDDFGDAHSYANSS